jgi:thioredoxin-like negative regulator of GroEL
VSMLALTAFVQASLLATAGQGYAEAYQLTAETGRPLVVLVGADWCPACQTMKRSVIPQLASRGILKRVAFAQINTDQESELARKMMRGGSIPQLLMFVKTEDGWQRSQLNGAQSVSAVEAFIRRGVEQAQARHTAARPVSVGEGQ